MSTGWVKLHRKLLDSRVFANEGLLRVWIYCLCRANHKNNYVDIRTGKGKTEVNVNPGEYIFGRNSVADDLNMNPSTLYKRMKKLESIGNINMQSNSHYTIVSICNWETYQNPKDEEEQPKEQASNNQVTGREQASNTDNNVKNVKNDKKYTIGDPKKIKKNQSIDYVSFVDKFNDLYDRQLRITETKREMIRGRLNNFTGEEILRAWENRLKAKFLNDEGSKYMGDWKAAMRNDEKIDNYLNLPEEDMISGSSNGLDNNILRKHAKNK